MLPTIIELTEENLKQIISGEEIQLDDKTKLIFFKYSPQVEEVPNNVSILTKEDIRKLRKGIIMKRGKFMFNLI